MQPERLELDPAKADWALPAAVRRFTVDEVEEGLADIMTRERRYSSEVISRFDEGRNLWRNPFEWLRCKLTRRTFGYVPDPHVYQVRKLSHRLGPMFLAHPRTWRALKKRFGRKW